VEELGVGFVLIDDFSWRRLLGAWLAQRRRGSAHERRSSMARHRGAVAAVNGIVRGRGAEMGRAEREGRDGDGKRKIGSPRCDSREYGCAACGRSETGAWSLTHLWRQSDGRMPGRRGQLRAWHDTRTCEGNLAGEPV
jgi:hypothetical protein